MSSAALPFRGAIGPALGFYRLNMRLNRRFWLMNLFNGLLLPLIVLGAFGQRMDADGRLRLLIGNMLLGLMMLTMRKTSLTLTADRLFGYRALLETTGLTRGGYGAAYALDGASMALLPLAVAPLGVWLAGIPAPQSWSWLAPFLLAVIAMFCLGIWIAGRGGEMAGVSLLANLVLMGAMAFCPIIYPAENVPALIRPLVGWLPPSLAAETMAAGWLGEPFGLARMGALSAWTVALAGLALRRFPWRDPGEVIRARS